MAGIIKLVECSTHLCMFKGTLDNKLVVKCLVFVWHSVCALGIPLAILLCSRDFKPPIVPPQRLKVQVMNGVKEEQ